MLLKGQLTLEKRVEEACWCLRWMSEGATGWSVEGVEGEALGQMAVCLEDLVAMKRMASCRAGKERGRRCCCSKAKKGVRS